MPSATALPFPAPDQRWLPSGFDAGDETAVREAFAGLTGRRPAEAQELLTWIADVDELLAALDAGEARRRIATTRDTTDTEAREEHERFQQVIVPLARTQRDTLDQIFLESPGRADLDRESWGVFDRLCANRHALHRDANVKLAAREASLMLRYDTHMGALKVPFRGEEFTPQGIACWLDRTERDLREQAWAALARARLERAPVLGNLFSELIALRREQAANAGFANYRDFRFRELERFDYGPPECEAFHAAVEEHVVPAVTELHEKRREALDVPTLRPWDLAVDPAGLPPLRPFTDADELVTLGRDVLAHVDPELAERLGFLAEQDLLDLANRPGKAPGGYQSTLEDVRLPFIFANAVGVQQDVRTLLHETGHAVHALDARDQPVLDYRHAPIEFCEVASMSTELLAAEQFARVYPPEDARRARSLQLEHALTILPWVATVDAFQQWLYCYPEHTEEERAAYWISLRRRFEPDIDWSGHEDWQALEWQRQLHLFKHPFYYIEYGIAQVGALQVWLNHRNKGRPAYEAWRAALALGGSRSLPELFTAAHTCFDFGPRMLQTLTAAVRSALDED
ncbi:MAG: M3 family oligoendopeptidase [Planctomycetota bacterium]|jgi:oligoendopeptidase F